MNCGCTLQHSQCALGEELFTAILQLQQAFHATSGEQRDTAWEALSQARIAYSDHMHGWRQGDVRIRQDGGRWLLERRHQEQWTFQLSIAVEETLRVWLKGHRFWRYAQIDGGEPQDRVTGYYHQRNGRVRQTRLDGLNTSFTTGLLPQETRRHVPPLMPQAKVDQKAELALLIALLVGRSPRQLTVVDRLYIQRKAVNWLVSSGIQPIEAGDRQAIDIFIEKAIAIRDLLADARNITLH